MRSPAPKPIFARALLHPLWLGSLAVLALNDHVLKGAGLLPGSVTGKLSDFAGLLVAPLLLAVLLRLRSRAGFWAAHVAVGGVFAAIQVSHVAADSWSAFMGLFGMPWVITSDPWDLIALPMLLLSAAVYPRVVAHRAAVLARRSAELAAAGAGLACCVATSPAPGDPVFPGFQADVYIHNDNDFDIVVRVRPLAEGVDLECFEIERDPGRLLTEPLFGPATSWTLAPRANMLVADEAGRFSGSMASGECTAFLVDAENLHPLVVFVQEGQLDWKWVEGTELSAEGFISIRYDEEGRAEYETDAEVVHELVQQPPKPAPECGPVDDAQRIAWSDTPPQGTWFLGEADVGPDGCVQMELRTGFEQESDLPGRTWTLCLPPVTWPFAPGGRISISQRGASSSDGRATGVEILALQEDDTVAPDAANLVASAGETPLSFWGTAVTFMPDYDCDLQAEPACGTVYRPGTLTITGPGFGPIEAGGESPVGTGTDDQGRTVEFHAVAAQEQEALHAECVQGPSTLGTDIEFAAVRYR